jgi:hypothetical protein
MGTKPHRTTAFIQGAVLVIPLPWADPDHHSSLFAADSSAHVLGNFVVRIISAGICLFFGSLPFVICHLSSA